VNLTAGKLLRYVIDTSTLIDLNRGNLLPVLFRLPCIFVITDLIIHELRDPPFEKLSTMGLSVEHLSPEKIAEIYVLSGKYEKPSPEDLSVLVLAKSKGTILITSDTALRHAAADNGVDYYGTCWLIDFLADQNIISYSQAVSAYNLIRKNQRFPPGEECRRLLSQWVKKRKLLE